MNFKNTVLSFTLPIATLSVISFGNSLRAEETSKANSSSISVSPDKPSFVLPRWRASTDRLHYNFNGSRPARNGLYSFEQVNFSTQLFNLSYTLSPTLSLSLTGTYNQVYAETYFGPNLYKDKTSGFGDTTLKLHKSWMVGSGVLLTDLGTMFPTGSIAEKNVNNPRLNYPYNMQLGSGTQDFLISTMYLRPIQLHSLGALAVGTVRTGQNNEGYRKGNELNLRTSYSYLYRPYLVPGIWLNYHHINRISGEDRTFGRLSATEFYHSPRSFWDVTPNLSGQHVLNKNLSLRGSVGAPILQHSKNVDDIQLYLKWFAQLGLQGSF